VRAVLIAHDGDLSGGANMFLLEAACALRERGCWVGIVVPTQGSLSDAANHAGYEVLFHPIAYWVGNTGPWQWRIRCFLANVPSMWRLGALIREHEADVVFTNTITTPSGAFAALRAGVPHIWIIHELFGSAGQGLHFNLGAKVSLCLMNRASERLIVVSEAAERLYGKFFAKKKIDLVRQSVGSDSTASVPSGSPPKDDSVFKLAYVSNVYPAKRQEDAIRATKVLRDSGIDARLVVVGRADPAYRLFLEKLIAELDVSEAVHLVGFSETPAQYLGDADVCLMCSEGEGLGRVTIEAMKAGKPVAAARSGGTVELVQDGINGLLYEPQNAAALAAALRMLWSDEPLRSKLGRQGQAWAVATYNAKRFSEQLWSSILAATDSRTTVAAVGKS